MSITIRQSHSIDADGVKQMIADHYGALGMAFHRFNVSFQVHGSHSSGFSSSQARLGDTTIHVPDTLRRPGAPASMTLQAEDVQAIVAARMTNLLGAEIAPGSVKFNVLDGGGSGLSRSGPSFEGAVISTRIEIGE